jgi:amino acid transporter
VPALSNRTRLAALALKTVGLTVGVASVVFALGFSYDEVTHLASGADYGVGDVVTMLAAAALVFAGVALIAQLPESLKARFRRIPEVGRRKPVYGFGTMVAVGVGATLGSPLFILIPLNIEQYKVVSLLSLMLAAVFSVAMAKVYSDMGRESKLLGASLVGSPSFVRAVSGPRSVRYFVSRVSMWVANTALAAYTKIVFLVFNFVFMPKVLEAYGFSPGATTVVVWVIAAVFVGWTALNIFFEQRYLRALGVVQVVLTAALILILVYHSAALGSSGGWDFSGFLSIPSGVSWVPALIVNTGYLYLLFFGFQEIQVLERDSVERSAVPVISWVRRGFTLSKTAYFEAAMILSVLVASAVNIFYGLAVYSGGHAAPSLQSNCSTSSCIPALYLAQNVLGGGQEVLIAGAFLIASVTTFVPAFLAAARHLGALGEDGYMPGSLASLSWMFTLVAVLLLAIGDQNFLVEITDVMVLVSLGIIALAGIGGTQLRKRPGGGKTLPLVVGLASFLFGAAVYFTPGGSTVVVFGSVALIFAYLAFDIIELGALGSQLFLSVFGLVSLTALSAFSHVSYAGGVLETVSKLARMDPSGILAWGLLVSSVLLAANVVLDVRVLRRTSV